MKSPSDQSDPFGLSPSIVSPVEPMLLDSKQTATFLALSERKLWGLSNDGEIPRVLIGRAVRYDRRDLIAWIDQKKIGSTPLTS